jgi:hypothetical protein
MTARSETTRDEHLAWCKQRALVYVDAGDLSQAFTSMGSDLDKHPATTGHSGIKLGVLLLVSGRLNTPREMRDFINGFH